MFGNEPLRYTFIDVLVHKCLSHGTEISVVLGELSAVVHSYFGMPQLELVPLCVNLFDKKARVAYTLFCFYFYRTLFFFMCVIGSLLE